MSTRQGKRIEAKKRKIAAFLEIARLNDLDRTESTSPPIKKKTKPRDNEESCPSNSSSTASTGAMRSNHSTELSCADLEKLRAEYRERRKASMELPKLYLTLENITHPLMQKIEGDEKPVVEHQPVLFMTDLQHLLLYAIQGNTASFKPRWCRLLRWTKVKHVMVIVVDDLSTTEFTKYNESFPYLRDSFEHQLDISTPSQYGSNVAKDLFHVPMSITKLVVQKGFSRQDAKQLKSEMDASSLNRFSRVDLLLNPVQMVEENFPLPVCNDQYKDYVYTCDEYKEVTDSSPMFALDCEMCLSHENKLVLTRVAMVTEKLEKVYDSLVKPDVPIKEYLTKYSGVTKEMLTDVTTRLQDVQRAIRQILPPDAILCGQSLNGDLHAVQMFHPYAIDTSVIFNLSGMRHIKPGLRRLTAQFLSRDIQNNPAGHNPVEDALATMELVNLKLSKGIEFGDVSLGGVTQVTPPTHKVISRTAATRKSQSSSEDSEEDRTTLTDNNTIPDNNSKLFFQRPRQDMYESLFGIAKSSKKSVILVGREEDLNPYKQDTETMIADTDKTIVREICTCHWNYDMIYTNLHGFSRCLQEQSSEDYIQAKIKKIDKRIQKMTKCLPKGSLVAVVFSGRTANKEIHNAKCFVKIVQ